MRPRIFCAVVVVASLVGFTFAAFSTYDFVQHLDRQVHGVHCSFLPGIEGTETGGSDCQVTLMSPYSSVFRDSVWGGIPVSLPGMAVFAFLAAFGVFLIVRDLAGDKRASLFLLLATLVPLLTSAVMGYISLSTLDAACKLCIGIYVSSVLAFGGALGQFFTAGGSVGATAAPKGPRRRGPDDLPGERTADEAREKIVPAQASPVGWGLLGAAFAIGLVFVIAPVATYAAVAPDFSRYVGACGELSHPEDENGVLIPIGPQGNATPVIEVLDPLCPACKGFEERFEGIDATERTRRSALLFPLDDECNWMVDRAIHPGACAVSEAMLCAGDDAEMVLAWAFENQEQILAATEDDPEAAARMAKQRFPDLRECIGSPTVKARLNLALRWAVENQLPVLTPQVYVGDTRLCDEDTDLGLDYALTRLIDRVPASPPPPRVEPNEEELEAVVRREGIGQPAPPPPAANPPAAVEVAASGGEGAEAAEEPGAGDAEGAPAEPAAAEEPAPATGGEAEPQPAAGSAPAREPGAAAAPGMAPSMAAEPAAEPPAAEPEAASDEEVTP